MKESLTELLLQPTQVRLGTFVEIAGLKLFKVEYELPGAVAVEDIDKLDANILEVDKSEVYSIDDYIWFASEKAYNDFMQDIKPMTDDVDFVQMDDFDEIGTRVTIWLDDDIENSITKLYSV